MVSLLEDQHRLDDLARVHVIEGLRHVLPRVCLDDAVNRELLVSLRIQVEVTHLALLVQLGQAGDELVRRVVTLAAGLDAAETEEDVVDLCFRVSTEPNLR